MLPFFSKFIIEKWWKIIFPPEDGQMPANVDQATPQQTALPHPIPPHWEPKLIRFYKAIDVAG